MSNKLSRNVLKEIVKECMLEIFEESFFGGQSLQESVSLRQTKKIKKSKRPVTTNNVRSKHLDNISYAQESNRTKELVKSVSKGHDPVMAEIFKDTAATTLQVQNAGERGKSISSAQGDQAAQIVSNSDPTELFAESSNKWAALAFADPIK